MKELFESFKKVIDSKKTFVLTTHVNPDGDGLGSEIALALYLSGIGKNVSVINQSQTPAYYTFMNRLFPLVTYAAEKHAALIRGAEVFIALDTNSTSRFPVLKEPMLQSQAFKVCIDHHLDREPFADMYLIDEAATATGEIIFSFLKFCGSDSITPAIAEALYTAIMTDTGSFRFPKTDAETHRIVAELLERGADPTAVYQKIFEDGPPNKLKLLGRALNTLTISHSGTIASMILRRRDFTETLTGEEDTDNMINNTLTIGGVRIGLMFVEFENGVKVSLRSKGNIAINTLAKEFGGNGHMNAAGARIYGAGLDDIVAKVTERAAHYV